MTDHPTLLGQADPPARKRRRPNGWELALWILGAALLGCGVLISRLVVTGLFANDNGSPAARTAVEVAQVLYTTLPGVVTAGLFCFILAIALRAFAGMTAGRRPVEPLPQSPAAVVADPVTVPTIAADSAASPRRPQDVAQTATGDYSRFMRPPADG
jgi:hypothetical protein